ncbi:hypothetical protein EV580_1362 [Mycobacterium sp. BK086]|uniref:hypothetical protein n=1 Tax=Mycobacterium sp. BK086 TaxID=2512165 RepID=UPI0010E19BAD|nr:hypothetical protein [Mycobacterium sp. BK086]TDO18178.1 hypothetical protein EV580_1362 [Mycobacterium sp. BK086]
MTVQLFALTAAFGFSWAAKGWWVREDRRFAERVQAELDAAPRVPVGVSAADVDGNRW